MNSVIRLEDDTATEQLGADLAMAIRPGDVVLLSGGLGAGKSTLARALLRHLAGDDDLEVPSPTYTLCQRYELVPPVTHFDLYRLGSAAEIEEIGLLEAMETGVVIVEWPERAVGAFDADALEVRLDFQGAERRATLAGGGQGEASLAARVHRSLEIRAFLDRGWGPGARRRFLLGDASARRYETVRLDGEIRIVMDAPRRPDGPPIRDGKPYSQIVHLAEDVIPFVAIAEILLTAGLAAPAIHARAPAQGLLLVEHLGDGRIVDEANRPAPERYLEAARLLAFMHERTWPDRIAVEDGAGGRIDHIIPRYDTVALETEASLMADWYAPAALGRPLADGERAEFDAIWRELAAIVAPSMPTLVLRDYHSPNLIWRPEMPFPRNLGLIDFQDAVIGPQAYDLASVGQDARVDVDERLEARMLEAYLAVRRAGPEFDEDRFLRDYAILASQRATKILGIFVRLDRRDGKPAYLRHLPRMRGYLARSLRHPALQRYRAWCAHAAGIGEKPS